MAKKISIDITGTKMVAGYLASKELETEKDITVGLKTASLYVEGEVKASIAGQRAEPTSVDTGRFLNSVTSDSGKTEAIISSNVEHAIYLEHGTTKLDERGHFKNTKNRSKDKVEKIIDTSIKI